MHISERFVRPAGVWDSRAPFHNYLARHKQIGRTLNLIVLASRRMERDLAGKEEQNVRSYFNPRTTRTNRSATGTLVPWNSYKAGFGADGSQRGPSGADVLRDAKSARSAARWWALLEQVSLFEAFLHCWCANYLLAQLESGRHWIEPEARLAYRFSPTAAILPSANHMLSLLPILGFTLATNSVFNQKVSARAEGEEARSPVDLGSAMKLWIAVRNCSVHNQGRATGRLVKDHSSTWMAFSENKPYILALDAGSRIYVHQEIISLAALCTYRAALTLSNVLEEVSGGRRGQPWAPEARPQDWKVLQFPKRARPLLLRGDHRESVRALT